MTSLGLEPRTCQGWVTFYGLNQDWNSGQIMTGKLWSQPGLEQRTEHTGKLFVSTRIGTEDLPRLGSFLSRPGLEWRLGGIIRVFNLCKGGILPYKGVGIQYSEKWRREIIR